jgi:hypothetical protein
MMGDWKKKWVVVVVVTTLVFAAGLQAAAQQEEGLSKEPTAAAMMADFVLVRPLSLVATAVGTVFFVASLPFSVPGGNTKAVFTKLVTEPAKFTFKRPLGTVD